MRGEVLSTPQDRLTPPPKAGAAHPRGRRALRGEAPTLYLVLVFRHLTAALLSTALVTGSAGFAHGGGRARSLNDLANPTSNVAPVPDYLSSGQCSEGAQGWSCTNPCVSPELQWPADNTTVACTNELLAAIDHARGVEGISPMRLPNDWYQLRPPEQLFVVANLERTARGLPAYLGMNAALNAAAERAARRQTDPSLASGFPVGYDVNGVSEMAGAWASGFSVLAADYAWMYNDGWGGATGTSNVDCTSATSSGCWSHRDELLGLPSYMDPWRGALSRTTEMGAGVAVVNGSGSFVDLLERPAGAPPTMTFTWRSVLTHYAAGRAPRLVRAR